MAEMVLGGCEPIPLASYLKALGVFRLVAKQKDKNVRGGWREEAFVLDTTLTSGELVSFFLKEYRPSPIISPWNSGSGFYFREDKSNARDPATGKPGVRNQPTAATDVVGSFANAKSNRFASYKSGIACAQDELKKLGLAKAPKEEEKRGLVMRLRARLPEECLEWFDAAVALVPGEAGETLGLPPLLGSGGNDGNLDFSSNFMQRLREIFDLETGASRAGVQESLEDALFGSVTGPTAEHAAIGQFAPGAAGGPNATAGFEGEALVNPWDYVLMLEGAVLLASSASRRLERVGDANLNCPFTVNTASVGGASATLMDERRKKRDKFVGNCFEVWMPLWERFAELAEVRALLSEGRATLGRRPVRDGLDFVRAVAALGVSRGVNAFQRYAFLQRRGTSMSATPMGRILVPSRPSAGLLSDLDRGDWLGRFRRYARKLDEQKKALAAPQRLQALALNLDGAIFAMTGGASPAAVQHVIMAVGQAAVYLASSSKARDQKEGGLKPPPRLLPRWFCAADDGTPEFRIAAALAGLGRPPAGPDDGADRGSAIDDDVSQEEGEAQEDPVGLEASATPEEQQRKGALPPPPFRAHLAPLDEKSWYKKVRQWSDKGGLVVWGGGSLERSLVAVTERRLFFATKGNLDGDPFDSHAPADLASVLTFLEGETDDARISRLVQGLAWGDAPNALGAARGRRDQRPLPLAYAVLKPFFAPIDRVRDIEGVPKDIRLPLPAALVARLRAGDVDAAVTMACSRARASGLPVTFEPRRAYIGGVSGARLLASLLIPIRPNDLKHVLVRAYPALANAEKQKEGPADAA
jgi:CRISPR-associated protein Csx17